MSYCYPQTRDLRDKLFHCPVPKIFELSRKVPTVPLTIKDFNDVTMSRKTTRLLGTFNNSLSAVFFLLLV